MKYLKFILQKYNSDFGADEENVKIITLGYYDRLTVVNCDDWHYLRPVSALTDNTAAHKDLHNISNEYTIRAMRSEDDGDAAEYAFWENPDKERIMPTDTPCMACCLINITDKYITDCIIKDGENGSGYDGYMRKIRGELFKVKSSVIKTALYFGLGYTDLILMLRGASFDDINGYINNMIGLTERGTEGFSVVSSTYTVCGMFYGKDCQPFKDGDEGSISASVDVTVADVGNGNTSVSLHDIKSKILAGCDGEVNCEVYSIFGSFDFRIHFKSVTLKNFYQVCKNCSILCRKENAFLRNVNTKVLNRTGEDLSGFKALKHAEKDSDDTKSAFKEFSETFNTFFEKYKIHRRAKHALLQVAELYHKVTDTAHCYEVRKIIGKFFADYIRSLCAVMRHMTDGESDGNSRREFVSYVSFIEDAIEQIRTTVSFLLFDIWRSDKVVIEEQSIAHPSIGSTAKLLFAYNNIIGGWNQIVLDVKKPSTDISFLITSGGCDDTFANNKFLLFDSVNLERKHPWIITIPESSLYDVKGTLFRLSHEFFHIRGDRLRSPDADYSENCRPLNYFKGLCFALSEYIVGEFDNAALSCYLEYLIPAHICDVNQRPRLMRIIIDGAKLPDKDGIEAYIRSKLETETEEELKFYVGLCQKTKELFGYYRWCKRKTSGKKVLCEKCCDVCKCLHKIEQDLVEKIAKKLESVGIGKLKEFLSDGDNAEINAKLLGSEIYKNCGQCIIDAAESEETLSGSDGEDGIVKMFTEHFLKAVPIIDATACERLKIAQGTLTRRMLNYSAILYQSVYNENRKIITAAINEFFSDVEQRDDKLMNYDAVYKQFSTLYKECFADCLAIKATHISSYYEYVFAFLYEHRSIKDFFAVKKTGGEYKIDVNLIYRFNAVRAVCFSGEKEFSTEEFNKNFDKFYPKLFLNVKFKEGFREELFEVLKHIEDNRTILLKNRTVNELIEYLKSCLDSNSQILNSIAESTDFEEGREADYLLKEWIKVYDR